MIHIDKYIRTAADDMHFRGGVITRGTSFTCKACGKHALFQIKGVIDELQGEPRTAFLQNLKARHAEHAKVCTTNAAAAEESEEEVEEVASAPALDPSKIVTWTTSDVQQSHPQWPARIAVVGRLPRPHSRLDVYDCILSNEHGKVRLPIPATLLSSHHPEVYHEATHVRDTQIREALVNKCTSAAIKSVLGKARDRHFRSARGKLERVLVEMHKPPPRAPPSPPSSVKMTVVKHRPTFGRPRHMKLCITIVPRPAYLGALHLNGDDYSSEHVILRAFCRTCCIRSRSRTSRHCQRSSPPS